MADLIRLANTVATVIGWVVSSLWLAGVFELGDFVCAFHGR